MVSQRFSSNGFVRHHNFVSWQFHRRYLMLSINRFFGPVLSSHKWTVVLVEFSSNLITCSCWIVHPTMYIEIVDTSPINLLAVLPTTIVQTQWSRGIRRKDDTDAGGQEYRHRYQRFNLQTQSSAEAPTRKSENHICRRRYRFIRTPKELKTHASNTTSPFSS